MAKKEIKKASSSHSKGPSPKLSKSHGSKSDSKLGGKSQAKGKDKSAMKGAASSKPVVKKQARPEKALDKKHLGKNPSKGSSKVAPKGPAVLIKKGGAKKEELRSFKKGEKGSEKNLSNKKPLQDKGQERGLDKKLEHKTEKKPDLSKKIQGKVTAELVKKTPEKSEALDKESSQAKKKWAVSDKSEKEVVGKTEKLEKPSKSGESDEKSSGKASAGRKGSKGKKTEESDLDDVGFMADDEIGDDEIGEYADELKAVEELDSEGEDLDAWSQDSRDKDEQEIILTDAEGRRYCRSRDCDQIAAVDGYCRFHYLLFWKKIQIRKKILADGKLQRYVEELTARYPDKFLELIRRDLRTEKDFLSAIQELEIDEGAIENDFEEDNSSFIEEVRTMGESGGAGGAGMDEDDY